LHWHGLNITGDADGASSQVEFGVGTKIGTRLDLNFPTINNNSTLLWVHAHPMLRSSPLIYTGVYGILNIIDDASAKITNKYKYPDNHIILAYQDIDLNEDGTQTGKNIYTFEQRSCFGVINGINALQWYTDRRRIKYVDPLYHRCSKNLIKIDLLNGTFSFRNLYVGVCDRKEYIKNFWTIQTDNGLCNPDKQKMLEIAPGSRNSILVNLNDFENGEAFVFFYNFDLTELQNDVSLVDGNILQANVPDLTQSTNPTPNPTPIPDPGNTQNLLTYPPVPAIPQIVQPLLAGNIIPPQIDGKPFTIKKFLKIIHDISQCNEILEEKHVIKEIRKIVFGEKNYEIYKDVINKNNFEFDGQINYLKILNPKYFYNLPDFDNANTRNFALFFETNQNFVGGGFPLGSTENIFGANRIITDLWNSKELDLSYAISQYLSNPNNFKPNILPTCLFKFYPANPKYMNYDMLQNDMLTVQLFNQKINYEDKITVPIASATIKYPTTEKPINIRQLTDLINSSFDNTNVVINGNNIKLSAIIDYDWTFYPYTVSFIDKRNVILKSVMIKNNNKSNYYIRLLGKWPLLQFFGKPLDADMVMMDMNGDNMGEHACKCGDNCKCTETKKCSKFCTCWMYKTKNGTNACHPNSGCCQKHNYDMNLQEIFVQYASDDSKKPILAVDNNTELIIAPNTVYRGFIDGFQSDNLMNFAVKMDSSERWIYFNVDTQPSHPFHFHLTSGFVDAQDPENSKLLVSRIRDYSSYLYSQDVYGIGPQQVLAFYLKFLNYNSEQSVLKPRVRYLGYMYHCHFMAHHDMNMMGSYFVYKMRSDYF